MIGKLMPKRRDGAPIARQVLQSAAYIDRSAGAERGDVLAQGQLNLIADTRSGQVLEMIATAVGAPRARSPIEHIVLSWRACEQPSVRQAEQALAILLEEAGLRAHQVLWTLHLGSGGNQHLHALISRVAPDADKATRVPFFHNAIGRAVALIEHVQGWQREPGAHFEILEAHAGEQHVNWYRTHGHPTHGLVSRCSPRGAGRAPRHGRDPEAPPGGGRAGRSDRDDHRWPGASLKPPEPNSGPASEARRGSAGPPRRAIEAGGGDRGVAPGERRRPHDRDGCNDRAQLARRLAAIRLRWADGFRTIAAAEMAAARDGPWNEPADGAVALQERQPMTAADTLTALIARRLAEIRMRQAYRAASARSLLARSVASGDALPAGAARAEVYQGEESAARRVIEVAGPIVKRASSWAHLHAALAPHGIAYKAKGSGAVFVVDGLVLKASTCRAASRTQLERRLGLFRPGPEDDDLRPAPDQLQKSVATSSPRASPGVDAQLFALARQEKNAASAARAAYDATYPALNVTPLLKAVVVGPAPRRAPNARTIAQRQGKPLPLLAPVKRSSGHASSPTGLLGLYHRGLQADRYRVVAERAQSQDPDRFVQLTPRSIEEIAESWTSLERAGGSGSAVYLSPISQARHHVVLSGLRDEDVGRLRTAGYTPALILHASGGRHEVVLTAANGHRPYEMAALADATEGLRVRLGIDRGQIGLRIDDPDHPSGAPPGADDGACRIYAQVLSATGATCERLGQLILHGIVVFAQRFGLGLGSRLARGANPDGSGQHVDAPLYWTHRADLLSHWQARWPDPSRIDALIARRMRGTGHRPEAVADLITACTPAVPRIGGYNWPAYGRRAAAHAFRDDLDAGWVFDHASPTMWLELEQAVKAREEANKPKPLAPITPPVLPVPPPARRRAEPHTTGKGNKGSRSDDWWD